MGIKNPTAEMQVMESIGVLRLSDDGLSIETLGGSSIASLCAPVVADPPAGDYEGEQSVTLATDTDGATIYYTDDGSAPTPASTEYTGAITVDASVTIKAIAVRAGFLQSETLSAAYGITIPVVPTTWDPANVDPTTVLSNGNLTATNTQDTNSGLVAGTTSRDAGFLYFEATVTWGGSASSPQVMLGFAPVGFDAATCGAAGYYLGGTDPGMDDTVGLYLQDGPGGAQYQNNYLDSQSPGYPNDLSGYTVGIAFKIATGEIWVRDADGYAYLAGNPANQGDPETGAYPTVTVATGGNWLIVAGLWLAGAGESSCVLNTTGPFTYAVPSTCTAWD